jgi:hypothetical protein
MTKPYPVWSGRQVTRGQPYVYFVKYKRSAMALHDSGILPDPEALAM